jgi:hypothetical protein
MDCVTIIYKADLPILRLQAKSLSVYASSWGISQIHFVINDEDEESVSHDVSEYVIPLIEEVVEANVVLGSRIVRDPGPAAWRRGRYGWYRQQLLKLRICELISSPIYLVLDAKNIIIRSSPSSIDVLQGNKPRLWLSSRGGGLARFQRNSFAVFGDISVHDAIGVSGWSLPSVTPYVFYTELVRAMLTFLDDRFSSDFDGYFLSKGVDISEFDLYFAYLIASSVNIGDFYSIGKNFSSTLFRNFDKSAEAELRRIESFKNPGVSVIGIQKERYPLQTELATRQFFDLLVDRKVFSRHADVIHFFGQWFP